MFLSGNRKSCTVRLTVVLIFLVLTETTSFPREKNDPGFAPEYEVPTMEVDGGREDRRSLGESKFGLIEGAKKREGKFHDRGDLTEAKTGTELNRLRRETGSNVDTGEVRTSKSKVDKKYLVGSETEKKGRRKMKMTEHVDGDVKRDSIKARARRQTLKPEKVDKFVREMGFYVKKAKNDCASRSDKGNCGVKRVERDTGLPGRAYPNSPEYYAERKRVMERFYARQREIADKYGRLNSTSLASVTIRNQTDFRSAARSPASTTVDPGELETTIKPSSSATLDNGVRFDLFTGNATYARRKYEGKFWNPVSPTDRYPFNVDVRIHPAFSTSSPPETSQLQYNLASQNCSLKGSVPQKLRKKKYERPGCVDGRRGDMDDPLDVSTGDGGQTWGRCSGRLVYQHNLLLGLKGTSKLDAIFEVVIEGPICITCVTAQRFNDTRAKVTLESGGRGENFAKWRLVGYENEGFSYILKIFGVTKADNHCRNI